MAANNINKIVRGNLNLKPWILSKNPSDIVNSYVEKLYKQIPNNFKNDLTKPRMAISQPENRASLRKTPTERISFPIISKPKPKGTSHNVRSPPMTAKNSFVNMPRRFLRSPNFKIYTRRKYASSASSSNASFLRTDPEERRKKLYKPNINIQCRAFTASAALPVADCFNSPGIAKYIAPSRIYNDTTNQVKYMEVTNAICKDLMSVDDMLKQKIRVIKPKQPSTPDPVEASKQEILDTSFKGWNHPSLSHLNKLTAPPMIKKPPTAVNVNLNPQYFDRMVPAYSLMSVKRKPNLKMTSATTSPRRENSRHQPPGATPHKGYTERFLKRSNELELEPELKPPVESPKPEARDPNDFVCRSRTPRANGRSGSQKNTKGTSKMFRRF